MFDFTGQTVAITGATGGIAGAILDGVRGEGLRFLLHARDAEALEPIAERLRDREAEVHTVIADLACDAVDVADAFCDAGRVDVLINNAGIYTPGDVLTVDDDTVLHTLRVNLLACWTLVRAVQPAMNRRGSGRIVNISSGSGSIGEGLDPPHAAYSVSKTGLNAMTLLAAAEAQGNVKVNAMCPGWVRTRMGGQSASRSPEEGADTALWLAALDADGPNGGFFRDREPIAW